MFSFRQLSLLERGQLAMFCSDKLSNAKEFLLIHTNSLEFLLIPRSLYRDGSRQSQYLVRPGIPPTKRTVVLPARVFDIAGT